MTQPFRTRLLNGEKLIGTMLSLPSASVAEVLADVGFDWLFVDGEHGTFEPADVQPILQAVEHKTTCLVRVPCGDEVYIKKMLDIGATGIIVPQVNTADQARDIVSWSRYTPDGSRGVGIARAHGYGPKFAEYMAVANDRTTVVVQAEHADAVDNIEAIAAVEGVDAVLIGPYDLSASLGKPGQLDDPQVVAAIDHITKCCRKVKMPLGIFGVTAEAVLPYVQKGYTLLVAGVDTMMLAHAASRLRDKFLA